MLVSVILVVCFGSGGAPSSRPEKTFTTIGFKDWKHATGKHGILACHANCYSHKQAVVSWNQYQLNLKQGTLISEQLSSARADLIEAMIGTTSKLFLRFCFCAASRTLHYAIIENQSNPQSGETF